MMKIPLFTSINSRYLGLTQFYDIPFSDVFSKNTTKATARLLYSQRINGSVNHIAFSRLERPEPLLGLMAYRLDGENMRYVHYAASTPVWSYRTDPPVLDSFHLKTYAIGSNDPSVTGANHILSTFIILLIKTPSVPAEDCYDRFVNTIDINDPTFWSCTSVHQHKITEMKFPGSLVINRFAIGHTGDLLYSRYGEEWTNLRIGKRMFTETRLPASGDTIALCSASIKTGQIHNNHWLKHILHQKPDRAWLAPEYVCTSRYCSENDVVSDIRVSSKLPG